MNQVRERILIVDDEAAVRQIIALTLQSRGYEVETAADGPAGLQALTHNDFALALLDIRMPGRDGVWLLEQVRAIEPDTSVIMVTAVVDLVTAVDCLRRGATDYLLKPVPGDVLTLSVERALAERRTKIELHHYRKHLKEKVGEQAAQIRKLYLGSVQSLAISLEAKDPYTRGHSERVGRFAHLLTRKLGLTSTDVELVDLAGRLHDIGKIGVRESVLNKPGKLTPEEFDHVRQHPVLGAHILEPIAEDHRLVEAVLHHHENWNGTGYPHGLVRVGIPPPAQILRVCDVFEALTSDRPYRPARPRDQALVIMEQETGKTVAPDVADAFLELLAEGALTQGSG